MMTFRIFHIGIPPGVLVLAVAIMGGASPCGAQELQPRRWSHIPIGMNVLGGGYAYTDADIAFDPVLLLEDVELSMHTAIFKYVHAFELFGKSARVDLVQAYSDARWKGLLDGTPASTSRTGLSDTTLRFAMQLVGAPPLQGKEFKRHRAAVADCETIVGVGLALDIPTGHYKEDLLLNLGSNRFTIRPQLGVVHNRGKWSAELTGSAWFFTDNDDFWGGNELENDPLFALQGHVVYTFRPGLWLGAGMAYGIGKESTVNGIDKDDRKESLLWGCSLGIPINPRVGVTVGYLWHEALKDTGIDSGTVVVGCSFLW